MAEESIRTVLDRLVAAPAAASGWDDVLRRSARMRRRRRLSLVLAVAALGLALVTSLAAAGQLAALVPHTKARHLVVRGQLRTPDGRPAGTITVEIARAAVSLHGRPALQRFGPSASFHVRWFLDLDPAADEPARAALYGRSATPIAVLCDRCAARDSGQLELTGEQASALVSGRATFTIATPDTASARMRLDRSELRRAVACELEATGELRCTRIYTGK